jgi:hypothetical protein
MGLLGGAGIIFMRETYAAVLLERKAKLLRKEHNNPNFVSKFDTGLGPGTLLKHAIILPFKMLFLSPVVIILSTYTAIVFAYLFLLFTTFPVVFQEQYRWGDGVAGLAYIGIGVGLVAALVVFSFLSDWLLKKQAGDGPMKPEHRLPVMKWTAFLIPIGLFWYGWSVQAETFWLVPIMGTSLIGAGAFCTFVSPLLESLAVRITLILCRRCLHKPTLSTAMVNTRPPPSLQTLFSDPYSAASFPLQVRPCMPNSALDGVIHCWLS